jgi:predicted secreted protein
MRLKWLVITAVSLLLLTAPTAPLLNVEAQEVSITGDTDKICVAVQSHPGTDKYGRLSVNPDGTFYPNDQFWIRYNVYVASDVDFEGVEINYDKDAFEKVRDADWGSTSGLALFKVKPEAKPGNYTFTVSAKASKTYQAQASGTVWVTYGGVDVDSYYRAECMLAINSTSGGTTNPASGSYWYTKGTAVSVAAIADSNHVLDHWLLDGQNAGSSNPITVTMDKSHTLTAIFAEQAESRAAGSRVLSAEAKSPAEPKLVIKDLKWTTWFDLFRGIVCQATGYLYDSNGHAIPYSYVTVEFRKRNFWTGATWVSAKTVRTNSAGYFVAEDACNPLAEQFLGVRAWAEKAGYIPSWRLSLNLDPETASVPQGKSAVVGVKVFLSGRYTAVPITFSATGVPVNCTVTFDPPSGSVEGIGYFQGIMLLKAQSTAQPGSYEFIVTVSSGKVENSKWFSLEITELPHEPSAVTFRAYGLEADASGVAATLDGSTPVYASQLPYTAGWYTNTEHSYSWSGQIGSTIDGKRYMLERVQVTERYVSRGTVKVGVVKYDPRFTVALAYTVPGSAGVNSYEKAFAIIVRYDGNGLEKNLNQRAVIEDWDWYGYASRISAIQQATGLTEISNVQDLLGNMQLLMQLFNLTRGVQFTVSGIDGKTEGVILKVDGESLTVDKLPKTYSWPENTTHTYEWTTRMPVYVWVENPRWGAGRYEQAEDQWFSFEYALVMIPELKVGANATQEQLQQLAEGFSAKLYSPSGKVNATGFGNRVTGVYSHNRLLKSIASDAGVQNNVLRCLEPTFPIFFDGENRYAKFVFDLDDRVAAEAISQAYNSSIFYEVSFLSNIFTANVFKANFTCQLEYYQKPVDVTAVKWDAAGKRWVADQNVRVEAFFDTAFNFTDADWFKTYISGEAADEAALKMALEDVAECLPQYFGGFGAAEGVMNRTSPYYYNLNITAGLGYYGFAPEPVGFDSWTENVRTYRAVWTSPTCKVSADQNVKIAGSASIKVEGSDAANLSAVLNLVKPVVPVGDLTFSIYLGEGCNGNLTVIMFESVGQQQSFSTKVRTGSWSTVTVGAVGTVSKIGIYCELSAPSGAFWVDRLYFTRAVVWKWSAGRSLERTVYVDFATGQPYVLYINLDPASPLSVNVTRDDVKSCGLTVSAPPQLGGLQNVKVYLVTYAPTGYSLGNLPIEKLQLKLILARNLTAEQAAVDSAWYYQGYAPTYAGSTLGFEGNFSLSIIKDAEFKALPGYNSTLLLIEAENVWGTTFHAVVAVQPWGKTFWEIVFEQVALVLVGLAVAACIISLVVRLLKGKMP